MPLIDVAYHYVKEQKQPLAFSELMNGLQQTLGLSQQEITKKISQFYTELNVDGRFLSLGENRWALRSWYPTDKVAEEVTPITKPKKKKKKKVEDDFDDYDELVEEEYSDEDDIDDDDEEDIDEEADEFADYDNVDDVDDEALDEDEIELDEQFDDDEEEA